MKDPVKAAIAKAVQSQCANLVIREDLGNAVVTTTETSPLVTTVRVRTDTGIRYFTIKVSENY